MGHSRLTSAENCKILEPMKSLKIALLGLALTLGLNACADGVFNITFTDPGSTNVGVGQINVVGGYAVSGYFDVTAGFATGNYTLYTAGGTSGTYSAPLNSPSGQFGYDNAVYYQIPNPAYTGNPPGIPYLDGQGLLFTDASNNEVNFWGNADTTYSFDAYVNNTLLDANGIVGASTITPAPEPSSLALIALLLAPAALFFRQWRMIKRLG